VICIRPARRFPTAHNKGDVIEHVVTYRKLSALAIYRRSIIPTTVMLLSSCDCVTYHQISSFLRWIHLSFDFNCKCHTHTQHKGNQIETTSVKSTGSTFFLSTQRRFMNINVLHTCAKQVTNASNSRDRRYAEVSSCPKAISGTSPEQLADSRVLLATWQGMTSY